MPPSPPNLPLERPEFKGVVEKLNQVYGAETSQMDPRLFTAQLVNIVRDEWR